MEALTPYVSRVRTYIFNPRSLTYCHSTVHKLTATGTIHLTYSLSSMFMAFTTRVQLTYEHIWK